MSQAVRHHRKLVIGFYVFGGSLIYLVFAAWSQVMASLEEHEAPWCLEYMATFILVWFTLFMVIVPFTAVMKAHKECVSNLTNTRGGTR